MPGKVAQVVWNLKHLENMKHIHCAFRCFSVYNGGQEIHTICLRTKSSVSFLQKLP